MNRSRLRSVVLLLAGLVSGCARPVAPEVTPRRSFDGATDMVILPPDGLEPTVRTEAELPPPQAAPTTLEQALPEYPQAALTDEVACSAEVLYHIETDGGARLVRLEWEIAPPDEHRAVFETAIRDAIAGWRFVPAKRIRRDFDADGKLHWEEQPIPKAKRALIDFRVVEGRGTVR